MHQSTSLSERRYADKCRTSVLHQLSITQKCSVNNLSQYGYQLEFSRETDCGNIAVLTCNGNIATVDESGDINTSPNIDIRM